MATAWAPRLLLLATMGLLLAMPVVGADDPAAGSQVTVSLTSGSLLADLSDGNAVIVAFDGVVTVSGGTPSRVQLDARVVGQDWDLTIDPASYPTSGNESTPFHGTVRVPLGADDGTVTLHVQATSNEPGFFPPGGSDAVDLVVVTHRIAVTFSTPMRVTGGTSPTAVDLTLQVRNRGDSADTFALGADDDALPRDVVPGTWALQLPIERLDLPAQSDWSNVRVRLEVPALPPTVDEVNFSLPLTVTSDATGEVWSGTVDVSVVNAAPPVVTHPPSRAVPWWVGALPVVGVAVVGLIGLWFIGGTEVGLLWLLMSLVPLYTRLRRDAVLDNFSRGQIYGYVKANAGCHYSEIQAQLEMGNGTLAHHLRVLEREQFVRIQRDGLFKRFYPAGAPIVADKHLSRLQRDILVAIGDSPGTTQMRIARAIDESKQVVHYHVKQLARAGLVVVHTDGALRTLELTARGSALYTGSRSAPAASLADEELPIAEPVLE